jgi:2-methylaconitate isomerase
MESAADISSVPFVCFVSPPADSPTLSGEIVRRSDIDVAVRAISSGQPRTVLYR